MALSSVIECNWPYGNVDELDKYTDTAGNDASANGDGSIVASPTFSGSAFSFQGGDAIAPRGKYFTATQIIGGVYCRHGSPVNASGRSTLYIVLLNSGYVLVEWNHINNLIQIIRTGVVVATAPVGRFTTINRTFHVGISCKADTVSGFVSLYIDGVQVVTFTGNLGTTTNGVFFGGYLSGVTGSFNDFYFGDFYAYDAAGEADYAPPAKRFYFIPVASAGFYSGIWMPVGAATNVQCVDDYPSDGDTTYANAIIGMLTESFVLAAVPATFIPEGYGIKAVVASSYSRRSSPIISSTITMGLRESGGSEQNGPARACGTEFGDNNASFNTNAAAGAWTLPQLSGLQVKIISSGSF